MPSTTLPNEWSGRSGCPCRRPSARDRSGSASATASFGRSRPARSSSRSGRRRRSPPTDGHSVAFGWPVVASVNQTVLFLSSMTYQSRPPPVTSYCHCSSVSHPPFAGGGGGTLATLGHSARRQSDAFAARLERLPQSPGELRIGVHLCRGSPLADHLRQRLVVVDRRSGRHDTRELI